MHILNDAQLMFKVSESITFLFYESQVGFLSSFFSSVGVNRADVFPIA